MEPKPLGRPCNFDHDVALKALMLLFWEKGYEAATQQDMIARTGLSSSSLLNAFGSKPQIFARVLEAYTQVLDQSLAPLRQGTAGLDDLQGFFDNLTANVAGQLDCPSGCLAVKTMAS
jgi:AcrR family transcriptional regulator